MNTRLVYIWLLFLFLCSQITLGFTSGEALKIYHEANIAYQKLDYENSIRLYEQLIKNKSVSEEVFYNLGNSYFKSGNFAKAILNYERAKKLDPDDEDINFNLKIASLKVVDKIESVPEIFYKKWINQFSLLFPPNIFSVILIIMVWLFFASAIGYVVVHSIWGKKISFVLLILFLFLTGISAVMAVRSHAIAHIDQQSIIMSASVYVKSSPDEKGNDLFILHEGTKVDVLDQLNNWKKIRIANGSIGWMKSDEMEII
jgi:tetratricopeptide (TPR) repeat protein